MADTRFFRRAGPFDLGHLAGIGGATLADGVDPKRRVEDVAPLSQAGPAHLSFLDNRKYLADFEKTGAGACFVRPELAGRAPAGTACLLTPNPYMAYALAAQALYPESPAVAGRHSSSVVDPAAVVASDCQIGPGVVVGPGVKIGARCRLMPNAVIDAGVEIGDDCEIGANAFLSHCVIGSRVRIYPGVCIGQPGFGFAMGKTGFVTVPQLGRVLIGDDVEVGANATIDRGAGPDTVIGSGTRIDNLVQLGHNVQVGRNCVIVAQTGISGSTRLGDFVMTGGQSGFAGHLSVGSGARVAAQSGVMRDVPPGGEVMGSPAVATKQYMRQVAHLSKLVRASGSSPKSSEEEK